MRIALDITVFFPFLQLPPFSDFRSKQTGTDCRDSFRHGIPDFQDPRSSQKSIEKLRYNLLVIRDSVDDRSVNLFVRSTVSVSSPWRPSMLTVYHIVSSDATTSEKLPVRPPS